MTWSGRGEARQLSCSEVFCGAESATNEWEEAMCLWFGDSSKSSHGVVWGSGNRCGTVLLYEIRVGRF